MCMFLRGFAKDKYVVKVDSNKPVEVVTENLVHKALKCTRCITQTKGKNSVFKETKAGLKSGPMLVSILDSNLVVS